MTSHKAPNDRTPSALPYVFSYGVSAVDADVTHKLEGPYVRLTQ